MTTRRLKSSINQYFNNIYPVINLTNDNIVKFSLTAPTYPIVDGIVRQVAKIITTFPLSVTTCLFTKVSRFSSEISLASNWVKIRCRMNSPVDFGKKWQTNPRRNSRMLGTWNKAFWINCRKKHPFDYFERSSKPEIFYNSIPREGWSE